jgi:hypothetical protein
MHIGLAAGLVTGMSIGGVYGRWEYVLVGDTIVELGVAEPAAASNETVATPAAWALLSGLAKGTEVVGKEGVPAGYRVLDSMCMDHPYATVGCPEKVHGLTLSTSPPSALLTSPLLPPSYFTTTRNIPPSYI